MVHTHTHTHRHIYINTHTYTCIHHIHTKNTCHTRSHMYKSTCYIAPTISKSLMIQALTPANLPPGSTGTIPHLRKAGKLNVECENLKYKETNSSWPASIRVPHVRRATTLACKVSQRPLGYPAFCITKRSWILYDLSPCYVSPAMYEPALVNLILSLVRFFNLWKITQYQD